MLLLGMDIHFLRRNWTSTSQHMSQRSCRRSQKISNGSPRQARTGAHCHRGSHPQLRLTCFSPTSFTFRSLIYSMSVCLLSLCISICFYVTLFILFLFFSILFLSSCCSFCLLKESPKIFLFVCFPSSKKQKNQKYFL